MKNLLLLFLFILLPGILFATAQPDTNPAVDLQSGLTDSFVEEVEQTLEFIIKSLHQYSVNGEFNWDKPFRGTTAAGRIEEKFSEMDLVMVSENVRSSIYRVGENIYEVRNIYFREATKENVREFSVRFDKFGNFTDVQFVDEIYSIAPFAGYNRVVESDDLTEVVQRLEDKYNSRDFNDAVSLFADDAVILAGAVHNEQRVIYRLDTIDKYSTMLRYVYNVNDNIDIKFSDITFYAHPFNDQLIGVQIHQDWQTTTYSDEGYLFLIIERNQYELYNIHYRSWHQKSLSPDSFPKIQVKKEVPIESVTLPTRYLHNQSVQSLPSDRQIEYSDVFVFKEESKFNRRALWIIGGATVFATSAVILLTGGDSDVSVIPIPPAGGK